MKLWSATKTLCFAAILSAGLFVQAYGAYPFWSQAETTLADGPDPAKLVGRWMRPDGGYILQLSEPGPDGRLKAAYFNPRPIHVARAAWKHQEGYLGVFIEHRAPNYPGSTYTLAFDQARDRLVGIYFQAAMQQKFEVEFERIP